LPQLFAELKEQSRERTPSNRTVRKLHCDAAIGFTRAEISYILLAEVALLIVVALPLGCVIGRGLVALLGLMLDTELFRLPLVIEPSTYGLAVVFALAATVASAALVRRRIDRLDLIRVLKTRVMAMPVQLRDCCQEVMALADRSRGGVLAPCGARRPCRDSAGRARGDGGRGRRNARA
jgi:hypothetical protein